MGRTERNVPPVGTRHGSFASKISSRLRASGETSASNALRTNGI
jgi:hypothetical protein